MKKHLLVSIVAASVAITACNNDKKEDASAAPAVQGKAGLETTIQKVSYGIGHNISSNFKKQNITLDMTAFNKGMADGSAGKEPALDQQAIMAAMQEFQKEMMEKQMAESQKAAEANKVESSTFLAENAKKEGVVTTESGLQYKVITKGTGTKKPTAEDTVVVHYKGTLLNGEEFDSSYSRNEPATFGVGAVIPGWTEALQLMTVGDKLELVIPSELAYGEGGAGQKIGPNATLKFEVELLEIVDPNARNAEDKANSTSSAEVNKLDGETLKK
jgi:FKBP-type peptidyl-prolyl cis-trans isomerase